MDVDAVTADLAAQRAEAVALLARLDEDVARVVAASEGSNADDEHDPEGATIGYERAQLLALRDQVRARVTALDLAAARVTAGDHGTCSRCRGPIGAERLAARPGTDLCVACAARASSRR